MPIFGTIPAEPPVQTSLEGCAPALQRAIPQLIAAMLARGMPTVVRETLRTNERQQWLYGFGRDYDDDRGIVTYAETAFNGWHIFGCAADLVHATLGDNAGDGYFEALAEEAEKLRLAAGWRWKRKDPPHVQLGPPMRATPTVDAQELQAKGGNPAVWAVVSNAH